MKGQMMDFPLTLPHILERVGKLFPKTEIVSLLPEKKVHRYTYVDFHRRARLLAEALQSEGLKKGDRVATLAWNHYRHLEAYFAIPCAGGVLHTLNLRLHPDDIAYIADHAGDRFLIVDDVLWDLYLQFADKVNFEKVFVISHTPGALPDGATDYEGLISSASGNWDYPEIDENDALGMCYTSGTTGRPKGVVYSHRAIMLHTLMSGLVDSNALSNQDTLLPVVPMFHANAWGLPFHAAMVGAKQVFPGPYLDPESLLDLFEKEQVTFSAGVPTIWMGVLEQLEKHPDRWKLEKHITLPCGGSAPPESMIRKFDERGWTLKQAWGMTELSPVGTFSYVKRELADLPDAMKTSLRTMQGLPVPWVECRIMGDNGVAPWDGQSMGELQVRGPWVAASYYKNESEGDKWTADGWFRTGDIAVMTPEGYVKLTDRTKDVIKSGGEWISSVDLENAIVAHPGVAEAAVIAVSHPKWQERPLAVVVRRDGKDVSKEEILDMLRGKFAKWWLPDAIEFVDEIPHTSTGKIKKIALREQFAGYKLG